MERWGPETISSPPTAYGRQGTSSRTAAIRGAIRTRSDRAEPQLNPSAWPFGLAFWPLWRALGVILGWNVLLALVASAVGLTAYAWLRELDLAYGVALSVGRACDRPVQTGRFRTATCWRHVRPATASPLDVRARAHGAPAGGCLSAVAIASIPASGQVHHALGAVPFYLAYALIRCGRSGPGSPPGRGPARRHCRRVLWVFTIDGSIGEGGRSLPAR